MNWTWYDAFKILFGGATTAAIILWIRFHKKDKADVSKVESEIAVDQADVAGKLSKISLDMTVNIYAQLEKAITLNEKRESEIDRLHGVIENMKTEFAEHIQNMKADFAKQIQQFEDELEIATQECKEERGKNWLMKEELDKLLK